MWLAVAAPAAPSSPVGSRGALRFLDGAAVLELPEVPLWQTCMTPPSVRHDHGPRLATPR